MKSNFWYKIQHYLGCTPAYETKILDKPIQRGGNYEFTCKIEKKIIRIFGIKILKLKYDNSKNNRR